MSAPLQIQQENRTGTPLRVLIVEDNSDDAILLICELQRKGYDPTFERVETREGMNKALDQQSWDIVIADYSMPHFNGAPIDLAACFTCCIFVRAIS